ncbi:MAG TPA: dihydrofolate reductase family protein, partial [Casimicrobiaceae bacterium]
LLTSLAGRGVNELHVEAGAKLTGALLEMGLIDELLLYCAPLLIGDPACGMFKRVAALASLPSATRVAFHHVERIGDDLRIVARVLAGKD